MRSSWRLWKSLAPVFFVLWPACMVQNVALGPEQIRRVGKELWPVWPASYRLVHKVQLDIRGRRLDFLGYLAVKGGNWRAVALTELGGTIFDLLNTTDGPKVLSSPGGLPRKPLVDGVMKELGLAFSSPFPATDEGRSLPVAPPAVLPALNSGVRKRGGAEEISAPVSMLIFRANRLVSEITIESFASIAGWSSPVPDRLKIVNRAYGYSMDVSLIRMDLRPVDDSVFKGDRAP
jgi:hypothetical protein